MEQKRDQSMESVGAFFQEKTKYTPERLRGHTLDWSKFPDTYKSYEAPLARITLPKPEVKGETTLWQLLQKRRSRRAYRVEQTITKGLLSALLWATQGLTARQGKMYFRTAPSAGGLYPVETYLSVRAVEGLEPGIYHFRPLEADLELLKKGNFGKSLARAALGQQLVSDAQVTFIWSAVMERSTWKYRERAYRYIYIDAGHIGQNLYLAAEALGLGACTIGAFLDDDINQMIEIDGVSETVIYLGCVGWPSGEKHE
ncbi:MAG TPA: SagB/ThcOx family dehydrogenase [Syntrophorhabdales bacterium]|nr:SagB/ThcOx family dehydrogenase [Syntrophorhabdales bacterium]